jgi:biotin carboxyl carrier protein
MTVESVNLASQQKSFGGRWTYAILITAFLFVLMPFLFWNMTWFGRPMTDAQITKAFADRAHPRETQHALSQIESRMESGDPSVRRWYPQLLALAANPVDEIRITVAWVMGQDTTSPDLHDALLKFLADPNPMVQRNAALSLVRFKDDAGHAQIVAMLRPYDMPSPFAGTLDTRLKSGDVVNPGTMVARIESSGERREVRARVPGTLERWLVTDKSSITAGQPILSLAPSDNMVWESLRALYLVGRPEDLPDVDRFLRSSSTQISQQAAATSRAIRDRSSS